MESLALYVIVIIFVKVVYSLTRLVAACPEM
jgi:hypothetical protein